MQVHITGVEGAPHTDWKVEIAHDPFLSPTFVAMTLGSALEATSSERRDMTYRISSRIELEGYGTLTLLDYGAGSGGIPDAQDFERSQLVKALGGLLTNPWEPVRIKSVETTIALEFRREVSVLRGAKVLEPIVDAGKPARIALTLEPYRGPIETRVLEVPLPAELAGREVEIELEPGGEAERALPAARNLAELLSMLPRRTYAPESVVATVRLRESGAAQHGKIASRLPPGALDTLRPTSSSSGPETFVSESRHSTALGLYLQGKDTVRVAIRQPWR
jgi:hypothetical protein